MNSQDTNTSAAVKYFKNNYIKMIIFILISLICTGLLSHKYYKDNELYFSKVIIRINESYKWNLENSVNPVYDVLYFLKNKNIKNMRLILNPNTNNAIEIEIPHKSVDDKNNKDLQKLIEFMEDYKKMLLDRVNQNTEILIKNINKIISESENEEEIKSININLRVLLSKKEFFIELLNQGEIFDIIYDGKINKKKAKRQLTKNLIIALMISIILIILSLWIKLFIREVKKNL